MCLLGRVDSPSPRKQSHFTINESSSVSAASRVDISKIHLWRQNNHFQGSLISLPCRVRVKTQRKVGCIWAHGISSSRNFLLSQINFATGSLIIINNENLLQVARPTLHESQPQEDLQNLYVNLTCEMIHLSTAVEILSIFPTTFIYLFVGEKLYNWYFIKDSRMWAIIGPSPSPKRPWTNTTTYLFITLRCLFQVWNRHIVT